MKITLKYDDEVGLREVETQLTNPTLEEALDAFGDFLRASGYSLDANEDVVVWAHHQMRENAIQTWEKED